MKTAAPRDGPQSVGRILSILEWLAEHREGATLTELATSSGAPKTSLVGLLAGLVGEGGVRRDKSGRYSLGPRTLALAARAMSGQELAVMVRPIMQALVDETGETAVLGALAPDAEMAVYVAKVESSNPVRYAVSVGERRELYCTAIGKVLLAHFDPRRLNAYLKGYPRRRYTSTTVTRQADLVRDLGIIRTTGVAITREERVVGASGIAAPIFARDGRVVAALLLAGPSDRMRAHAATLEKNLRRAATECSTLAAATS